MVYPNWIPDANRFKLAGPPAWFLSQLWEFDSSLVIIPSRMDCIYRLAQRRKMKLAENVVNDILKEQADTQMLASYGLVPVTTILATVNWSNPFLFEELRRRAPWRLGGAEQVIKQLEGQERADKLAAAIRQDSQNEYLARDGWKYYQKQIGTRTHAFSPKTPNRVPVSRGLRRVKTPRYRPDLQTAWGNVLQPRRSR